MTTGEVFSPAMLPEEEEGNMPAAARCTANGLHGLAGLVFDARLGLPFCSQTIAVASNQSLSAACTQGLFLTATEADKAIYLFQDLDGVGAIIAYPICVLNSVGSSNHPTITTLHSQKHGMYNSRGLYTAFRVEPWAWVEMHVLQAATASLHSESVVSFRHAPAAVRSPT